MRKLFFFVLPIVIPLIPFAQEITGEWNGLLNTQAIQLRLVINISKTDSGYKATMDSPDQGAKEIPVTSITFENAKLKFAIVNARIEYEGILGTDNIITGGFKQAGQAFSLNFSREKVQAAKLVRPQEPVKPYSYRSEDVSFENKEAGISL